MNYIFQNRATLEGENYILKADTSTGYWVGLSRSRINQYRSLFNLNFNIIIFGDKEAEGDFYVIPYSDIKDVFTDDSMYQERERWVADIKNHIIRFRVSNIQRNISQYYSIPIAQRVDNNEVVDLDIKNDYAIENARREINIRLKQSFFREEVLKNFDYKCCLTNVSEENLLVASHIIPWSEKIETRLDPGNGLCLSVLLDKLFDKGYFSLDVNLNVILTSRIGTLSAHTQSYLKEISGKRINSTKYATINEYSLNYHRTYIFNKH